MMLIDSSQGAGADAVSAGAASWSLERRPGGAVLLVRGEVDLAAEVGLSAAAEAVLVEASLQCDLSDVTFIDSSGLGIFLQLRNRHEARFVVSAASESAMRVFELSGVTDYLMGFERPSQG